MVTLRRLTSSADAAFPELYQLYVDAFPADERRSRGGFESSILLPEMNCNVIEVDGVTAGFSIVWRFSDFAYLEHFAVKPSMRGGGIGAQVLKIYSDTIGPNIILEVEPDTDPLTHRRIEFYKRHGYHIVSRDYIQPLYEADGDAMPLWIMASCSPSAEVLERWIAEMKRRVYGR